MIAVWKLIPTVVLLGALVAGFTVRPPREPVAPAELRRLMIASAALYAAGGVALLGHRRALAGIVFATGLLIFVLTAWLARATPPPQDGDDGGQGGGGSPPLKPVPSGPDFDWTFYEDQFGGDRSPETPVAPGV
jgi:hypothetical protein